MTTPADVTAAIVALPDKPSEVRIVAIGTTVSMHLVGKPGERLNGRQIFAHVFTTETPEEITQILQEALPHD